MLVSVKGDARVKRGLRLREMIISGRKEHEVIERQNMIPEIIMINHSCDCPLGELPLVALIFNTMPMFILKISERLDGINHRVWSRESAKLVIHVLLKIVKKVTVLQAMSVDGIDLSRLGQPRFD